MLECKYDNAEGKELALPVIDSVYSEHDDALGPHLPRRVFFENKDYFCDQRNLADISNGEIFW